MSERNAEFSNNDVILGSILLFLPHAAFTSDGEKLNSTVSGMVSIRVIASISKEGLGDDRQNPGQL